MHPSPRKRASPSSDDELTIITTAPSAAEDDGTQQGTRRKQKRIRRNQDVNSSAPNTTTAAVPAAQQVTAQQGSGTSRKRMRPHWERTLQKALAPFSLPTAAPSPSLSNNTGGPALDGGPKEPIWFHWVPTKRHYDPNPAELVTSPATLCEYNRLSPRGTCVIATRGKEAFCKVHVLPFKSMAPAEIHGWEQLVAHFFHRPRDSPPGQHPAASSVENNSNIGSQLARMARLAKYDPKDNTAEAQQASKFIAKQLNHLAPGVVEYCLKSLMIPKAVSSSPSPARQNDDQKDGPHAMFSLYDFFQASPSPPADGGEEWRLVVWVPLMNPATCSETDAILADERFDMLGGQLAFRDFQVFLDMNEVPGVVVCLFKSSGHSTQTLPASSPSNKYSRIAIDARLSDPLMSTALVSFLQGAPPAPQ